MFDQLNAYFIEATEHVRAKLGEADISGFQLRVESSGRTLSGDAKISYSLSNEYSGGAVTGCALDAVVEEYLRRQGWNNRHAPLMLSGKKAEPEEIEF